MRVVLPFFDVVPYGKFKAEKGDLMEARDIFYHLEAKACFAHFRVSAY